PHAVSNRCPHARISACSHGSPAQVWRSSAPRRYRIRSDRRGCPPSADKTNDGLRCARLPDSDSLGNRRRRRCDETHCRTPRRRHDHLDDSRSDSGAGVLRADEGTCTSTRNVATEKPGACRIGIWRKSMRKKNKLAKPTLAESKSAIAFGAAFLLMCVGGIYAVYHVSSSRSVRP